MFGVFYFAESYFAEGPFTEPTPPTGGGEMGGFGIGQKRTFAMDNLIGGGGW